MSTIATGQTRSSMSGSPATPWLSIVIPAHEDGHWLAIALASLVAQSSRDFECILVDSSADDGVARVAATFEDRLDLRIERRADLVGWQRKTNYGVELARAAHFCMLHPDDFWEPTRAERVRAWLDARPDEAMHLHPNWIVDETGRRLGLWRCPLPSDADLPDGLFMNRLIVQNFISVCAPVIRRDVFERTGGFQPDLWYTGDWDLYLKLGRLGPIRYHDEALACYRIHGNAMTISGSRQGDAFRAQLQSVLDCHLRLFDARVRRRVGRRAKASVAVNVALAGALHGRRLSLFRALWSVARLGPLGLAPFLRDTRLVERVTPRVRMWVLRPLWSRRAPSGPKT